MHKKKYGPNTAEVEAYLALLPKLTDAQWAAVRTEARTTARDAEWEPAWDAAWDTAWHEGWAAERNAAWDAAWDVTKVIADAPGGVAANIAIALVARSLLTSEQFGILTTPMRAAGIDFESLTAKPEGE